MNMELSKNSLNNYLSLAGPFIKIIGVASLPFLLLEANCVLLNNQSRSLLDEFKNVNFHSAISQSQNDLNNIPPGALDSSIYEINLRLKNGHPESSFDNRFSQIQSMLHNEGINYNQNKLNNNESLTYLANIDHLYKELISNTSIVEDMYF